MKTKTLITGLVGAIAVVAGILYGKAPEVRNTVHQRLNAWIGWSDQARKEDPAGFVTHVAGRLESDLGQLQTTRHKLSGESRSLNDTISELQAKLEHAERLAGEFREAYQRAATTGSFPVVVRSAAYTEPQAVSQVSSLLAEQERFRADVARLQNVRQQAETKLEALTVRIDATEAELAALPTKRELLQADRLNTEGQQLVAAVDALFAENQAAIAGNPVRSVRELVAAAPASERTQPNRAAAQQFLAARSAAELVDAEEAAPSDAQPAPKREAKRGSKAKRSASVSKPIFQQS